MQKQMKSSPFLTAGALQDVPTCADQKRPTRLKCRDRCLGSCFDQIEVFVGQLFVSVRASRHKLLKRQELRFVSKPPCLSGAEIDKGLLSKMVELAACGVCFLLPVPAFGLKCLKPRGKSFESGLVEFGDEFSICSTFVMIGSSDITK
jgi:hypothetical protein